MDDIIPGRYQEFLDLLRTVSMQKPTGFYIGIGGGIDQTTGRHTVAPIADILDEIAPLVASANAGGRNDVMIGIDASWTGPETAEIAQAVRQRFGAYGTVIVEPFPATRLPNGRYVPGPESGYVYLSQATLWKQRGELGYNAPIEGIEDQVAILVNHKDVGTIVGAQPWWKATYEQYLALVRSHLDSGFVVIVNYPEHRSGFPSYSQFHDDAISQ